MSGPDSDAHRQATRTRSAGSVAASRAIAVAGVSRTPGHVGRLVLDALVCDGFKGPMFPVNPHAAQIGPLKAYPSVAGIGEPADLDETGSGR